MGVIALWGLAWDAAALGIDLADGDICKPHTVTLGNPSLTLTLYVLEGGQHAI